MENLSPFFDLCVSDKCLANNEFSKTAKRLLEYGYKTIAISTFLHEDSLDARKGVKKKKGESSNYDLVPDLTPINNISDFPDLIILRRLTVIFSDGVTIHKVLKSENFKKYDIFAILPTSQKAMQFACSETDADIISFNPEVKTPIKFNRKLYNLAVERGMYFEVMYAPAICGSLLRKNIITMSHSYHAYGKSNNIILTSWATHSILIRGPYDVITLGSIFGLNEEQSKNAISSICKNLLIRAEGRKLGKVVMIVNTTAKEEAMLISDSEDDSDIDFDLMDEPVIKKSKS